MSDSQTQMTKLAPRPQLPTPAVTAAAEPVNAPEVKGVEEMQEVQAAAELSVAKPAVHKLRVPIKRIEQPTAGELPVAKPVTRHPVRRPKLEAAVAEQRAKELAATLIGLQDVTAKCVHMAAFGAFFEVTEGKANGFSGLLHINALPGGKTALDALKVGDFLTLDITDAPVETRRNKPVVKLAFDGFGKQRRAAETHNAVFARGDVPSDGGNHWVKARRGKERFYG